MSLKQRVLIADDEPTVTDTYATMLEQNGVDVVKTYDGEECLRVARSSHFDLILIDVHMPQVDGYEVTRKLRSEQHLKRTPIVLLTGFSTSPANIETGYHAGASEYWKKPMTTDEFVARARSILRTAAAERKLREMEESFTSMIVHDLRGPLAAIIGYAELLAEEKEKLGPDYGEMVDQIVNAGSQLQNIVNSFLEITHLETQQLLLSRTRTNLLDLLERAAASLARTQQDKSIRVGIECDKSMSLFIDAQQIEEVFTRLLDNSLRYTPHHGSVTVSATADDTAVTVTVTDTGSGIPEADLAMLFDKMRIVTPGAKRPGSKTGLGLPICRSIVEAHSGAISAVSKEGFGTTITIVLPSNSR